MCQVISSADVGCLLCLDGFQLGTVGDAVTQTTTVRAPHFSWKHGYTPVTIAPPTTSQCWDIHVHAQTHKPHAHTQITHTHTHEHTHMNTHTHTHTQNTHTDLQHPGKFHCRPAWRPGTVALSVWLPSADASGPAAQIHLSTHSDQYFYSSVNTQWSVFLQFCQHSDQYIYSSVNTQWSVFLQFCQHTDQFISSSVRLPSADVSGPAALGIVCQQPAALVQQHWLIYQQIQWSVHLQFCQASTCRCWKQHLITQRHSNWFMSFKWDDCQCISPV